ncbi:MAG: hypothetical protein II213_02445, partial [Lachnospiraceae bacterium]|nr:hypothetical protein [Lachnospiraceae bacterium]
LFLLYSGSKDSLKQQSSDISGHKAVDDEGICMTTLRFTGRYYPCFGVAEFYGYAYFTMGKLLVRLRSVR